MEIIQCLFYNYSGLELLLNNIKAVRDYAGLSTTYSGVLGTA